MKIKLLFFFTIICGTQSFAQNILNDSISKAGKLIQQIKVNGKTQISLEKLGCEKIISGNNACVDKLAIEYLKNKLTDTEIEILNSSENPTLKYLAFLLYANRNNNKELLKKRLEKVFAEEFVLMSDECTVETANSLSSLGRMCFLVVIGDFPYFKPKYKISETEQEKIIKSVEKYEKWKQITCP